ncbi:MAG: methylenetetrahydrofolate--tRNA-(uracil(54)-C(5))-methyltransferase (FADH(2)-oxidizing) TrmFO [Acidobacteriota bacterium]|nr:methylenetetrahydrofolate--tRNA-(uracil(54)-C(5))-methyltransferase (FADH(2)-oxidizing) TrmFO [Acidobacteriota bacterium]
MTVSQKPVQIVGAGLAGAECAFQLAERGVSVVLHEMRPVKKTPAHKTGDLAELVCSNSLRSDDPHHAAGLLKREMERFGSLIISSARRSAVPAGSALAVDRERFAAAVTGALEAHPLVEIHRNEVRTLPEGDVVIASGPLTSKAMSNAIADLLGGEHLYFYDAIAPIVESDSLNRSKLFWASRYGKGGADYLNSALDREQYGAFLAALLEAEILPLHEFEKNLFFEGCLPIEELARRGPDTLRFGPMKPVGLTPPSPTQSEDRVPYAIVQMRQENLAKSHLNLVGFQSRMKWPEQKRVLRMIPGLEQARFVRLGQIHRNTFINSPVHLNAFYRLKVRPLVRLAGQITGVEGYLESAATGLAVALYLTLERQGVEAAPLPFSTALGALARHLTESNSSHFQPANINYGLFPDLAGRVRKRDRRRSYTERAAVDLEDWAHRHQTAVAATPAPLASGAAVL